MCSSDLAGPATVGLRRDATDDPPEDDLPADDLPEDDLPGDDLPEGGTGLIANNTFVQGRNKENWTGFIVLSAEAKTYRTAGLRVENNDARLAPGETRSPAFVADYSHERLAIGANTLGAGVRKFETR